MFIPLLIIYTSFYVKKQKFRRTKECEKAFIQFKKEISRDRVLLIQNSLVCCPTDASPIGVAAVLSHMFNDVEKPTAFASYSLTENERNYTQLDREALEIIY